jgi:two-component system, sporulation sensor kinase E
MPRKPFIHKVLNRLDRVDRESVQNYLKQLAHENTLQAEIFDHLNEGILLASGSEIIYANRQASLWLGTEIEDRTPVADAVQDRELADFITNNLRGLKQKSVGDVPIIHPREMTLRVILVPLESGKESDVLILLSNISEEKNRQDDNMSRIEALASLAAGIAHEIGNPLNSISIHLELLKKDAQSLPENKRKSVEKTLEVLAGETSRLDRIVRNFLKATRKPPLRFKNEDLNQILEDAVRFMAPELEKNKIKASLKTDKALPGFMMDRERLYQAFINLVKNAMEAMPKGGTLSMTISHRGKVAHLSFKDEGGGIHEKDLPHIFDAYYTTKEEGSGLGLMTVYNVVREHGGRIEVASKTGKGSVFTLHLPIRQPKLQLGYKK